MKIFHITECPYSVTDVTKPKSQNIHRIRYGIKSASFVELRSWDSLIAEIKVCTFLSLKHEIGRLTHLLDPDRKYPFISFELNL